MKGFSFVRFMWSESSLKIYGVVLFQVVNNKINWIIPKLLVLII